jgi:hypothetical protein
LLQDELEEFKKNAAVVQREKEELEKEMVALKESVIKQKADWRSVELQINAENYGLQRALRHFGTVSEGMSEKVSQLEMEAIQSRQAIELLQREKQEGSLKFGNDQITCKNSCRYPDVEPTKLYFGTDSTTFDTWYLSDNSVRKHRQCMRKVRKF